MAITVDLVHSATDASVGVSIVTFTGVALGAAAADREIIVGFGNNYSTSNGNGWVTGVTLDGVPMTRIAGTNSARTVHASTWRIAWPTGTTGTIVVTKNTTGTSRHGLGVWRMIGRAADVGNPPYDIVAQNFTTSTFTPNTIKVANGGALIVFCQRQTNGAYTFTGPTEDFDISAGSDSRTGGASMENVADDPVYQVGIKPSGGAGRSNSIILMSFGVGTAGAPARKPILMATNKVLVELIPPVEGGESNNLFTIPAGTVASDLSDFVVKLDLADFGPDFWDNVTPAGENLRVFSADGAEQYPVDVVKIDRDAQTGEAFFKASLSAGFDNEFDLRTTNAVSPDGVDAPYGRHAVWEDYEAVFIFTDTFNRVRAGAAYTIDGTAATHAYMPTAVGPDVASHQGVAYDGTNFYVMHTNRLRKYNGSWTLLATNSDPLGDTGTAGVNHMGDVFYKDGELFSVYEKYPASGGVYNNQHVGVWDASDLSFKRTFDISANLHEVSSITWDPVNGYFVITDYTDAGATVLHKYDEDFAHLGTITTASIANKQGISYYDNRFWITTAGKKLFTVNLDGSARTEKWSGTINGYMEGIASKGDGTFYILFDGTPSAIYTFSPAGTAATPGWLNLGGSGNARATVAKLTVWTMGASVIPSSVSANAGILSYTPAVTSDNSRASLMIRPASSKFGLWNSTNTWLNDTGAAPAIGVRARVHHTQNGTTNRKIYQNGVLGATSGAISQRPAGDGNVLFMGAEDTSFTERMSGLLNYVYLRNGELSADWIAAEYASWEGSSFYDV